MENLLFQSWQFGSCYGIQGKIIHFETIIENTQRIHPSIKCSVPGLAVVYFLLQKNDIFVWKTDKIKGRSTRVRRGNPKYFDYVDP